MEITCLLLNPTESNFCLGRTDGKDPDKKKIIIIERNGKSQAWKH